LKIETSFDVKFHYFPSILPRKNVAKKFPAKG